MTNETQEDQPLKLEVGETYEDEEGQTYKILVEHHPGGHHIFVGFAFDEYIEFQPDGSCFDHPEWRLVRKHTPPPEVKPIYIAVHEDGTTSGYHNGHAPDDRFATRSPISHIIRFDPPWEPGRRDDLRDKEAGK